MSPSPYFSHPARDPPSRIGRLSEDLSSLGRRLCESIAVLVGRHAGDAVRDTIEAALGQTKASHSSYPDYRDNEYPRPYRDLYADDRDECYDDYGRDSDPWSGSARESIPSASSPPPVYLPAWWSLLSPALQLLNWWLRQHESRRPLVVAFSITGAAVLAYLAVSPVMSLLVASTGTALTLSGLIGSMANLAAGLRGSGSV
jgi:hypothetical protein